MFYRERLQARTRNHMAIFDFLKKKEEPLPDQGLYGPPGPPPIGPDTASAGAGQGDTPTEYVLNMQRQGLTNNQIIQILQRQGYSQRQIYDALNQVQVKGAVEQAPLFQSTPSGDQGLGPPPGLPPASTPGQPSQQGQSVRPSQEIEATVEAVVEERWKDVDKRLEKEKEWKAQTDARLARLEQYVTDLKGDLDNLHRAIVSKISDYDKNLLSVGTEIKAMEKVFQKVLPTLTESVGELSRITKEIKAPGRK